eukprot:3148229-Pleurochrysis_carterae.AAC.1
MALEELTSWRENAHSGAKDARDFGAKDAYSFWRERRPCSGGKHRVEIGVVAERGTFDRHISTALFPGAGDCWDE